MTDITPKQAQELLEEITPAPWCHEAQSEWWDVEEDEITVKQGDDPEANPYQPVAKVDLCDDLQIPDRTMIANADLITAAPDMAEQIAEMQWEYVIQQAPPDKEIWATFTNRAAWSPEALQGDLREMQERFPEYRHRIARRLVGKPEEIS